MIRMSQSQHPSLPFVLIKYISLIAHYFKIFKKFLLNQLDIAESNLKETVLLSDLINDFARSLGLGMEIPKEALLLKHIVKPPESRK